MAETGGHVVTGLEEGYVGANRFVSSKHDGWSISRYDSLEQADQFERELRQAEAEGFWMRCTLDTVHRTVILSSADTYPRLYKAFGLTWVAVLGMDKSIAVVTRHRDLDMKCVSQYHQTLPKSKVIRYVTEAIASDVEALPYDDDFCKESGLSMKNKPFSIVSVYPATKTDEASCSLAYDKETAIKLLSEKMECEPVLTLDDAIKTAIYGFKHLCREELKAKDYWVSFHDYQRGFVQHMKVSDIEQHLAAINEWSESRNRKREGEADGLASLCD